MHVFKVTTHVGNIEKDFDSYNIVASDFTDALRKVRERQLIYKKAVQEIQLRFPSLKIFDPTNLLCDDIKCYGKKGDEVPAEEDVPEEETFEEAPEEEVVYEEAPQEENIE